MATYFSLLRDDETFQTSSHLLSLYTYNVQNRDPIFIGGTSLEEDI